MGFFNKLFKGIGKKSKADNGPMPTRALNLAFDVSPENGEKFAEQFVDVVRRNEKINLDYSIGTLDFVDKFLQRFSDEGLDVNDFAETIFVAGPRFTIGKSVY